VSEERDVMAKEHAGLCKLPKGTYFEEDFYKTFLAYFSYFEKIKRG
jgi:hypothetical protein